MMQVICTDVYDKDGNLLTVEAYDTYGNFVMQFLWDAQDAQTSQNRELFRKFAYRILEQKGYKVN